MNYPLSTSPNLQFTRLNRPERATVRLVLNKWILAVAVATFLGVLAILAIAGFFLLAALFPAHPADSSGTGPTAAECAVAQWMRPPGCPTGP